MTWLQIKGDIALKEAKQSLTAGNVSRETALNLIEGAQDLLAESLDKKVRTIDRIQSR